MCISTFSRTLPEPLSLPPLLRPSQNIPQFKRYHLLLKIQTRLELWRQHQPHLNTEQVSRLLESNLTISCLNLASNCLAQVLYVVHLRISSGPFWFWTLFSCFVCNSDLTSQLIRVAEVVRRHEKPSLKSLDLDKTFKPKHTLFCCDSKICRDLRTFWKTLGKKNAFLGQNSVSWARSALLHGIYCIFY